MVRVSQCYIAVTIIGTVNTLGDIRGSIRLVSSRPAPLTVIEGALFLPGPNIAGSNVIADVHNSSTDPINHKASDAA